MQHAVDVFLAIFDRLFHSELLGLLVFLLKFLQLQSHAPDIDFIRTLGG